MERFVHMLRLGLQPMAVLQDMCLKRNTDMKTIQQFIYYCNSSGIAIQREAANMMIEQFAQHKQRLDTMQQNVYSNMHKAGVPIEAIQQKAELEGVVWNPMSNERPHEEYK